jgi:hypothetical protein
MYIFIKSKLVHTSNYTLFYYSVSVYLMNLFQVNILVWFNVIAFSDKLLYVNYRALVEYLDYPHRRIMCIIFVEAASHRMVNTYRSIIFQFLFLMYSFWLFIKKNVFMPEFATVIFHIYKCKTFFLMEIMCTQQHKKNTPYDSNWTVFIYLLYLMILYQKVLFVYWL